MKRALFLGLGASLLAGTVPAFANDSVEAIVKDPK